MEPEKKLSLFAQRMKKLKEVNSNNSASTVQVVEQDKSFNDVLNVRAFGERSNMVTGEDGDQIHRENVAKLASMSANEIAGEQARLLAGLDPAVVQFLHEKKRKSSEANRQQETKRHAVASTVVETPCVSDSTLSETLFGDKEKPMPAGKWLHMDIVEKEKLKWTEDLPPIEQPTPDSPYSARFSFDGELLAYLDESIDPNRGLHHHGEEPQRPGYTLQEVIQLTRSASLQQRLIALRTLSNIIAKASYYAGCLDRPLLPQLLDAELFLLLRFSMDDPVHSVVMASAAALANLLYNTDEEMCLDHLLDECGGLWQPSFSVSTEMNREDLAELKDTELVRLDLIRGALRSNMVPRLRYIIVNMNPEPAAVSDIIRILIRIVRHSSEAATAVACCPELLSTIRILLENKAGVAYTVALKLFRIIACWSRELASSLVELHSLTPLIYHYITNDYQCSHHALVLEGFHTLQTLLVYHLGCHQIRDIVPVLTRLLDIHFAKTDVDSLYSRDLEQGAALLQTLCQLLRTDYSAARPALSQIMLCAHKWLSQLTTSDTVTYLGSKLVGAALNCLAVAARKGECNDSELGIKIQNVLRCSSYAVAVDRLRSNSWLLHGSYTDSPECLPNLPLQSVPPNLMIENNLPLLSGLVNCLLAMANEPKLIEAFLFRNSMKDYIGKILNHESLHHVAGHWMARQEITFLVTLVQLFIKLQVISYCELYHQLALIVITVVHVDQRSFVKTLISSAVFNTFLFSFSAERLCAKLEGVQIGNQFLVQESDNDLLSQALNALPAIQSCYMSELNIDLEQYDLCPVSLTGGENGTKPALPIDWHFMPIIRLHNIDSSDARISNTAEIVTSRCLQWVLIVEALFPQVAALVPMASRFCKLACVFLIENNVFRDVTTLLEATLHLLLRSKELMDFEKPVAGLSSFYDFYRSLLEQYAAVSYCDPVFGQFVLVPLRQRHSCRYRRLLWMEMTVVLRLLSTPVDQVEDINEYLEPRETEIDLLTVYMKCLKSGRVSSKWCPVLHRIAQHHVAEYLKYKQNC